MEWIATAALEAERETEQLARLKERVYGRATVVR